MCMYFHIIFIYIHFLPYVYHWSFVHQGLEVGSRTPGHSAGCRRSCLAGWVLCCWVELGRWRVVMSRFLNILIESNYMCSSWKLGVLFLAIFLRFTMSGCSLGSSMHWFEDVGNLKGKHSGF